MHGRLKRVCSIAGILTLTIAFLFAPIGCGKPIATTSGESKRQHAAADQTGQLILKICGA